MEASLYLEVGIFNNEQTTKKSKIRQNRVKLAFAFSAIVLLALFPYVSFTVEATHLSPIQPLQQQLIQYLLNSIVLIAFVEALTTPANWHTRRRKIE